MQQPIQSNECAHSIVVLVYIGVTTMKKRVYTLYRVSTIGQVEKDDIPMQKKPATNLQNGRAGKSSRSFQKKAFPVLRNLQKTAISSNCFSRLLLPESLMFCWCSCLTVWVGVTTKRPLSWNGSRSKGSRSGA